MPVLAQHADPVAVIERDYCSPAGVPYDFKIHRYAVRQGYGFGIEPDYPALKYCFDVAGHEIPRWKTVASVGYDPARYNAIHAGCTGGEGVVPYFERQPLSFSCTRCGRCCQGGKDYHVYLSTTEATAICASLGVSWRWFRRHYLVRLDDGELVAANRAGACIFLGTDGQCTVYAVRPVQCRTYPFWPEVVCSATAWQAEARRCEGINRGNPVSVAKIRKSVGQCLEVTGQEVEAMSGSAARRSRTTGKP